MLNISDNTLVYSKNKFELLLKVEQKIKDSFNIRFPKVYKSCLSERDETLLDLLYERKKILNDLFLVDPDNEEINLFFSVNKRINDLLSLLHERMMFGAYHLNKLGKALGERNKICGKLSFVYNGDCSVLQLHHKDYRSDFRRMMNFIEFMRLGVISEETYLGDDSIVIKKGDNDSHKDVFLLRIKKQDLKSCDDIVFLKNSILSGNEICAGMFYLVNSSPYSIPDIIRMNDFWVEISLISQKHHSQSDFLDFENTNEDSDDKKLNL